LADFREKILAAIDLLSRHPWLAAGKPDHAAIKFITD
jgi:hypothetical protein